MLLKHVLDDSHAVVVGTDVVLADGDAVVGVLLVELLGGVPVAGVADRDRDAAVDQPFADG